VASLFSRSYRKVMENALNPLGFRRKASVFWREQNEILHIVSLHRIENFTADIAVQPLVFPFDTFILSLGARLDHFGRGMPPRWEVPSTKLDIEHLLEQFAQKVIVYAIPWLDRFQSTRDIVEIDAKNAWGVEPPEWNARREIVGLCALDAEVFDRGKELLSQVYAKSYSKVNADVPQWVHGRREMFRELLELLEDSQHEKIRQRLEEYKAYTRTALGIK
jgi:hypothetical protein